MKHSIAIAILCLLFSGLQAQNRLENKLDNWWETNTEKCVAKAEKYLKKHKAEEKSTYYLLKYNLQEVEVKPRKSQWNSVLRYAKKGNKYSSEEWNTLRNEIAVAAEKYCENLNHKELESFNIKYINVFKDTLQAFKQWLANQEHEKAAMTVSTIAEGIDSLRRALLSIAQNLEGIPYKWAGEDTAGFDCSGFTRYVYKSVGINLPHNAQLQSEIENGETKTLEMAEPGDLLFFGNQNSNGTYHVAHAAIIFSKEQDSIKVIHCVSNGVSIDGENSSWEHYWKDRVLFAKSFISN